MPLIRIITICLLFGLLGCTPSSTTQEEKPRIPEEIHNILFLGDQIHEWSESSPSELTFSEIFQEKVEAEQLPFFIINEASRGANSEVSLAKLDPILENSVEILVLFCGQADLDSGKKPETCQQNIQEIIDRTHSKHPNSDVVLVNTIDFANDNRKIAKWDRMLTEMAMKNHTAYVGLEINKEARIFESSNPEESESIQKIWKKLRPLL